MLVIGDREVADGTVAVRSRAKGDLGARPFDAFLDAALAEVEAKTLS
jgi:threonyl-tRNA synthetase